MFNNPFSMVVAIVFIVSVASIVRARFGLRRDHGRFRGHHYAPQVDHAENEALRTELKALKDRVAVLERLATDSNSSSALEREFEKLRQQQD